MRPLEEIQASIARAIRDPERPAPAWLTVRRGDLARRFAVYRNNVHVSLTEALAAGFPVTRRLVGEEFFRAMARVFVGDHPPCSPVLLDYGEDFPDFIAAFPPAASVPYLADMARLEWAHSRACHAADAAPLDPASLAGLSPDTLAALRLVPHPAARWLSSSHPIVTIWQAHQGADRPGLVLPPGGEDALVTRPHFSVGIAALPGGGLAFLAGLAEGRTLSEAAEAALDARPDFDLARVLAMLLAQGAFAGLARGSGSPDGRVG